MDDSRTEQPSAADGDYTTRGRPHGFSSLTPFLALEQVREAIDFYEQVFGAEIIDVTEIGGVIAHAELQFEDGRLQVGAASPDHHLVPPPAGEDDCYSLGLYCADVDGLLARAEEAGATVREAVTTFVSGDRYASIRDPFGVRWSVMTRVEDLSPQESSRRVADWASQQG